MKPTPFELIEMHRAFLHDISSPLMVAQGTLDQIANKNTIDNVAVKDKLSKVTTSLTRISDKLDTYRKTLAELQKKVPK